MKLAGLSSLVATGVLALTISVHAAADQSTNSDWPLAIGEESSILENPTFVSQGTESDPTVPMAAASSDGASSIADSFDKPGRPDVNNSLSDPSSELPSVPLPAPVLLAGIGLAGLILCRNKIGKLMR